MGLSLARVVESPDGTWTPRSNAKRTVPMSTPPSWSESVAWSFPPQTPSTTKENDREAAGAAAALALSGNTIPRDIAVEKLQQVLQQAGAFIGRGQKVPEGL